MCRQHRRILNCHVFCARLEVLAAELLQIQILENATLFCALGSLSEYKIIHYNIHENSALRRQYLFVFGVTVDNHLKHFVTKIAYFSVL